MIELAIAIVILVVGCGGSGVALAWLNDRRVEVQARRAVAPDPKRILDVRLAKGEIDEAEYQRRTYALTYGPPLELDQPH